MKPVKHRNKQRRMKVRQVTSYDPDFKKAVILYAEQKGTSEAKKLYGISESNIRRWRKLKTDIYDKSEKKKKKDQSTKRRSSKRNSERKDYDLEPLPPPMEQPEIDPLSDIHDNSNSIDSMPLQQRLSSHSPEASTSSQPPLQSQPLSPTKLKVTRQSVKAAAATSSSASPQPPPPPKPEPPQEPPNEEVCLRWNSHHSNMQTAFPSLLLKEQYVDVTLVAEGQTLKCHRMILSSCSIYFEEILQGITPYQHPVLFMKDIPFWILKSLCDFMYCGEVHIFQDKLNQLLSVAEALKIKGLAGKSCIDEHEKEKIVEEKPLESHLPIETNFVENPFKPSTENSYKPETSHRSKRYKADKEIRDKEREKAKVINISQEEIDPLDLLEPVYEEVEEKKLSSVSSKIKEPKNSPVKKSVPKKVKKRKYADHDPMTGDEQEDAVGRKVSCKYCKKHIAYTVARCINCGSGFHTSCSLRIVGLAAVGKDNLVKCCDPQIKRTKRMQYAVKKTASPPPVFHFRKGTRSRPNVKIPKYYHSDFGNKKKASLLLAEEFRDQALLAELQGHQDSPQPSCSTSDPLMEIPEIKAEPIDVEDNVIVFHEDDSIMDTTSQSDEVSGNFNASIANTLNDEGENDVDVVEHSLSEQPGIDDPALEPTSEFVGGNINPMDDSNSLDVSNPLETESRTQDSESCLEEDRRVSDGGSDGFKKISLVAQPIITEVRSLVDETEKDANEPATSKKLDNVGPDNLNDHENLGESNNEPADPLNDPLNVLNESICPPEPSHSSEEGNSTGNETISHTEPVLNESICPPEPSPSSEEGNSTGNETISHTAPVLNESICPPEPSHLSEEAHSTGNGTISHSEPPELTPEADILQDESVEANKGETELDEISDPININNETSVEASSTTDTNEAHSLDVTEITSFGEADQENTLQPEEGVLDEMPRLEPQVDYPDTNMEVEEKETDLKMKQTNIDTHKEQMDVNMETEVNINTVIEEADINLETEETDTNPETDTTKTNPEVEPPDTSFEVEENIDVSVTTPSITNICTVFEGEGGPITHCQGDPATVNECVSSTVNTVSDCDITSNQDKDEGNNDSFDVVSEIEKTIQLLNVIGGVRSGISQELRKLPETASIEENLAGTSIGTVENSECQNVVYGQSDTNQTGLDSQTVETDRCVDDLLMDT